MEVLIFIAGIIAIISTRKIWNSYFAIKAEQAEVWVEDCKNEMQPEIKRVLDDRTGLVEKNGKFLNVKDIQTIEFPKNT